MSDAESFPQTEGAPEQAPPADVAPADVAPADVAPADVAPADVAPADVAPADAAPAYSAREYAAPAAPAAPTERVLRGLLAALGAVVAGVVLTVVIWEAGYIASITSFVIAAGAVYLYSVAAGAPPRKGLIPVIVLVAVGVVVSFFAVVAVDLADAYDQLGPSASGTSKSEFVSDNLFNGKLLKEYQGDMARFGLFALLGVVGTLRRQLRKPAPARETGLDG